MRTRPDVEARFGPPIRSETWDNGWVLAEYAVKGQSESWSERPTAMLLYTREGTILGWKAPWGSGPPLESFLVSPIVRLIEKGQCPAMTDCVRRHEAGARRLADWLGSALPPSIEQKFRLVRQIAADADAGRLSVSDAAERLIALDSDEERRYPSSRKP